MVKHRNVIVVVAVVVVAFLCVTAGRARAQGGDGLKAGDVLGSDNWQKAEGLLPPEVLEHYKKGEYINPIVDWPVDHYNWPPDFLESSKQNEGKYAIGGNGEILDKATGKHAERVFGHPFPTIDASDPSAGTKVVWNYFYRTWYFGNLHADSQVNWVAVKHLERRTDQNVNFLFYDGVPEKELLPNPQNFNQQQLIVVVGPADLNGTAALTWRYRDPTKRDSAWAYVPALRRVRAVSPANRSDGFLGSDMAQDDGPFFDGKPEDFTWKLNGEVDQLRLVDPLNLKGEYDSFWLDSGGWRVNWPELKMLGYQDPTWQGVAWAPISGALAKRRFLVIEGIPKDRYYLFGRLEFYIDKQTYQGAWNRKFAWSGELLTTYQVMSFLPQRLKRANGQVDYNQGSNMAFQCAESLKRNQATVAGIKSSAKGGFDLRVPFDAGFFDMNSLARFGK